MACYAAVASLVQLLEDIIHHNRYPNFLDGQEETLKSLHEKFSSLHELLQDYSSKGREATDLVERRIGDAAYEAEDIIESEISDLIRSNVCEKIIHHLIYAMCPLEKSEERLKRVVEKVDSIVEEVRAVKDEEDLQPNYFPTVIGSSDKVSAARSEDTVVGFDEYLTTIKEKLCGYSSNLRIIPIVGMGGIGKTTLARHAFDDPLVVYRFDRRAWVSISQEYNAIKVLKDILKSIGVKSSDIRGEGEAEFGEVEAECGEREAELKESIYKYLKRRRYLIVIDDLWQTNHWEHLMGIFPDDCNGSRIILTTRLLDVACYVGDKGFLHEMQFLNKADSWSLLQEKVFSHERCPPELEDVGKFIAYNCQGLPLAIVAISGVLADVKTLQHWRKIAANVSSVLNKNEESFCNILALSYKHLPHHLKACFLHMGSFPEDYKMNCSQLIKLWIAEGFLKQTRGSVKSLEEVAEECLEDLVKRSLVIVTKKSPHGRLKHCVMHDLLRDFCRKRALHESFFHNHDYWLWDSTRSASIRRISVQVLHFYKPRVLEYVSSHVRSIVSFSQDYWSINGEKFVIFKLLRVLNLNDQRLRGFPDEILQLFHLKYLEFSTKPSFTEHLYVPPSIIKLQNLQTLIIKCPFSFRNRIKLPSEIWKMPRLRHLIINSIFLPPIDMVFCSPPQELECLQTLSLVENFKFTNEAVAMIPNLRKLGIICHSSKERDPRAVYHLNNLFKLPKLDELKIEFHRRQAIYVDFLAIGFSFPLTIRKLSLKYSELEWRNMTVVGSLPNLQVLRLKDFSFVGSEWKPEEGEFPKLKFMLLERLDLKYWKAESDHFPCLERLEIRQCSSLVEIPLDIGNIDSLRFIEVRDSPLAEKSAMRIQEEQRDLGNEELQVHVSSMFDIHF